MSSDREKSRNTLRQMFDKFDHDKDGSINKTELKKGFKDFGLDVSDDQIHKMMDIADSNKNHTIEWDEFYHILQASKSQEVSDIAEHWLQFSSKPIIHAPQETPSWKLLIAGGFAGAVSRTCTSPLERLKILRQVSSMNLESGAPQYGSVFTSLRTMYRTEGLMGLFKGNGTNVIRIAPYSAIQFLAYEKYKEFLMEDGKKHLTTAQNLIVGGAAGVTSLLFTYPLDLIRARLTVQINEQKYNGILNTYRTVVKEEGYAGLYKGLFTSALGVAPYVAINFTTYESLKYFFTPEGEHLSVPQSLLYGAVSGATAQTFTYPIDLLRRRLQVQGIGGKPAVYSGPFDACKKIVQEEGVKGLYKGMIPCYLKVIPAISISFCVYELMKNLLGIDSKKVSYSSG
ncbi:EF-hand domain-containing protein [Cavenderia fasciculata]|uniref:EF-hand domain-containing protein n=1 Tax=Cavenderia fasciculata TaxID=261658 RepID=F4PTK5_CACFS|nr:EF-hand domain-containing protein [Cavenderia fasciculata]EGG20887.1 EF-hand domain-containing protein [Cavenderia fasciculata]|eukprot:XP_004358737.1 EF-hand domain-containing protein [Cavenderia fasciculata]